jgi:hypothetical protein
MADRLFSPGSATDSAYINLRAGKTEFTIAARDFVERLWAEYSEFADPNFLTEVRRTFQARFWEMYLTCSLLAGAATRGYRVSCPKPGPDILLEFEGHRVWIEAVIVTDGAPGLPDSVVEPNPDRSGTIPEEKIVLRYTSAIREKYSKYLRYLRDGRTKGADAFVIAINASYLSYKWTQAENDAPRFLKALYPLGPYQLLLDKVTGEIVGSSNEPRFHIVKASGAEVPVQTFLDRRWRGISAVLCSFADAGSHRAPLGFDFELAHNPMGRCPIQKGLIPGRRAWVAKLTDTGGDLLGQMLNG